MKAPRLVTRALVASFLTVALVLGAVFAVLSLRVREQVRQLVADNLASAQQVFTRVEARRQQDMRAAVATLAENPTLKAALDIWLTERATANERTGAQLLVTVQREADKIAERVAADVLAIADGNGRVVASSGRLAASWPRGAVVATRVGELSDRAVAVGSTMYHVVSTPLQLGEAKIGSLEFGTALDGGYARELGDLSRGHAAIVSADGTVLASTLSGPAARDLAAAGTAAHVAGTATLSGETWAIQPLSRLGSLTFLALASVDAAAATQTVAALQSLAWVALGAMLLAVAGSMWLARTLTRPIDTLSRSLAEMMAAGKGLQPIALSGSSRELDQLTYTFNALMASLESAEDETEATYLGAVRALAAALDARDPYTAGHSERVSRLAVAMGEELDLDPEALETLRLGALLHDIGKIGVPDEVLRKPGVLSPAEFEAIKTHPTAGARILRSIPFLAPHIPIVELHHERPDGLGYPYGLRADEIPLPARIVHVADAFDAMTSARAYRSGRIPVEAIAELRSCMGTHFDGPSVEALIAALPRLVAAGEAVERPARPVQRTAAIAMALLCCAGAAYAQPSRLALDVVAAADMDAGSQVTRMATGWFDVFGAVRVTDDLHVRARPVVFRRSFDGAWTAQIYELALRYERPGRVGVRFDAGQFSSPLGLSILENRPDRNPVVSQHSTLYLPIPRYEAGTPNTFLLAAAYPLGARLTVSGGKWDARVAVTDSSPIRNRPFFGDRKPPRLANGMIGAGVTPRIGLRIGGALAHGSYAAASEVRDPSRGDRAVSVAQVEGEWSFGYTRLAGEWLWSQRELAHTDARVDGGWIEAAQTLTPRLFVAARYDEQWTRWTTTVTGSEYKELYRRVEAAAGVKLTPELTLRGSFLTRKGYVVNFWDEQVLASVVYAKRLR